jgi:hypothetical protein
MNINKQEHTGNSKRWQIRQARFKYRKTSALEDHGTKKIKLPKKQKLLLVIASQ